MALALTTVSGVKAQTTGVPGAAALSTEITGNGSPQNYAHGLGVTPGHVVVVPTDTTAVGIIAGGFATSWTADATNVAVTASNTLKYRVLALP